MTRLFSAGMRRLLRWLRGHWWAFVVALLMFVALLIVGNVVLAVQLKYLVDAFDQQNWNLLYLSWYLMVGSVIALPVLAGLQSYLLGGLVHRLLVQVRTAIYERVLRLPQAYYESHTSTDVGSVLINDTNIVGEGITTQLPAIASGLVGLVVAGVVLLAWSPGIVVLVVVLAALSFYVNTRFARPVERVVEREQATLAEVRGDGSRLASGALVVKSLGAEQAYLERFRATTERHAQAIRRRGRVRAWVTGVQTACSDTFHPVLELVAGLVALAGRITPGTAQGIAQLGSQVVSPATQLASAWSSLHGAVAASERIEGVLKNEGEVTATPNETGAVQKGTAQRDPSRGPAISLDGVSFTYPTGEKPALRDISFEVPHGCSVALVGESGSGKSTVLRLLLGFYGDFKGSINVEGVAVAQALTGGLSLVRRHLAYCPQDLQLFRGSIRNNLELVLGGDSHSDSHETNGRHTDLDEANRWSSDAAAGGTWYEVYGTRVARVLEAFYLPQLAAELSEGWETPVTELSGGQRQRVAVARTFLRGAPIALLDEPTSYLDVANEGVVHAGLRAATGNSTVIFSTHRVVNLEWVDHLLVFDAGQVVEEGPMAELLSTDGKFRALYEKQR